MPRKAKVERPIPAVSRRPEAKNKFVRWRRSVEELLIAKWQPNADVENVAATVVGMFDAGASDAEVAFFLRSQEQDEGEALLSVESSIALAQELRGSAALPLSTRSDEER
jgi:hypothetical protein